MKTFKFLLVLRTHENTDVFITLDDNIYGIHIKRINILCISSMYAKILQPLDMHGFPGRKCLCSWNC